MIININEILDNGISGDIFISSFSMFFRDLLVCKNKLSQNLATHDKIRLDKLIELSEKTEYSYLIEYINILNDAEINFQRSINQRLLIELAFLKITSLEYNEEKKKFKYKLISTLSFKDQVFNDISKKKEVQKKQIPVANIEIENFKTSTLSLKSIEKNKELDEVNTIPEEVFSNEKLIDIEDVLELWNEYTEEQEKKGRYNIASILRISKPTLKDNCIYYEVSNNTSSLEIESEKHQLIQFFRNRLKVKIELQININKSIDKKVAYTNQDKYELLKKKNPSIENLKNIFKLSV